MKMIIRPSIAVYLTYLYLVSNASDVFIITRVLAIGGAFHYANHFAARNVCQHHRYQTMLLGVV